MSNAFKAWWDANQTLRMEMGQHRELFEKVWNRGGAAAEHRLGVNRWKAACRDAMEAFDKIHGLLEDVSTEKAEAAKAAAFFAWGVLHFMIEDPPGKYELWRCTKCGVHWKRWPSDETWSVCGTPQPCCNNMPMGDIAKRIDLKSILSE